MEKKVFTIKEKIGYGAACIGDTATYNLMVMYGMFFMTDVAGLPALAAGNITFVATAVNACSIFVIGQITDKYPLKGGKRLPYMRAVILPMAVLLVMFFSVTEAGGLIELLYYAVALCLLMIMHSTFMVTYEALGADLTTNSGERMSLRSYARLFMGFGNVISIVALLPVIELLQRGGKTLAEAWQVTVIVIAVIGIISQITTCVIFKDSGKGGKGQKQSDRASFLDILIQYKELLSLRPFVILLVTTVFINAANVFCSSGIVYFMKYNLGIGEDKKAVIMAIYTFAGIFMTPVLHTLSRRYDKRRVMLACYLLTGIVFLYFGAVQIPSFNILCFYMLVFAIGTSAFWQLIYPMFYDIGELDEYENGEKRSGAILSAGKIIMRFSNAFATQFLGTLLFWFNYDATLSQQASETLFGIQCSLTYIPGVLFVLAAICIKIYPVSEIRHMEIVLNLEKRRKEMSHE